MQVVPQLEAISGTGYGINEVPQHSLARTEYAHEAEFGVNEQVQYLHTSLGRCARWK